MIRRIGLTELMKLAGRAGKPPQRSGSGGKTIVVLGAGMGGLVATETLLKFLGPDDRVILVDRTPEQVIGLSLLWVMRGWQHPRAAVIERPAIYDDDRVEFLETHVRSIAVTERTVTTANGHLHYDALVVALGAELDTSIVPGLPEALDQDSAGQFYTLAGAERLLSQLNSFSGKRIALVVTRLPYRCPAAPYEGAMLIEDLLTERRIRAGVELSVFTPEPMPMPVLGPQVGREVVKMLEDRGIHFNPKMEVSKVESSARELYFASGEVEQYDLLVAIPPHRPPTAVSSMGPGWIPVDAQTLKTKFRAVWAVGDVGAIALANGKFLPKAGVFATGQAEAAGRSVARYLGYEAPELSFDGRGGCWLEVGQGKAAYGEGRLLAEPNPAIEFHPAAVELHLQKEEEQRRWIARWQPAKSSS